MSSNSEDLLPSSLWIDIRTLARKAAMNGNSTDLSACLSNFLFKINLRVIRKNNGYDVRLTALQFTLKENPILQVRLEEKENIHPVSKSKVSASENPRKKYDLRSMNETNEIATSQSSNKSRVVDDSVSSQNNKRSKRNL